MAGHYAVDRMEDPLVPGDWHWVVAHEGDPGYPDFWCGGSDLPVWPVVPGGLLPGRVIGGVLTFRCEDDARVVAEAMNLR
ncbi:hypothetical protein JW921_11090 [Candidatus Fermentibacterales bacterium]|nr:hypothetical protein [Candidatus Fermentibacterales bacterium]